MADLVKRYAQPLLYGDVKVYQDLGEQQSSDAAEYTREVHLRAVRKQAETAWQSKDYETFLSLYSDMQGDLTPSEFMKFQHAEKELHYIDGAVSPAFIPSDFALRSIL